MITPDIDELLPLLADPRRRVVLELLATYHSLSLAALAEAIAEREQGVATADVPAGTTDRIRRSLHHNHLPKLDRADLISYAYGDDPPLATRLDSARRDRVQGSIREWPSDTP